MITCAIEKKPVMTAWRAFLSALPPALPENEYGYVIIKEFLIRLLKKSMKAGCSKMLRCKACEIMRNEAYFSYAAVKHDERNAADGRFSTAC